MSKDKKGSKKEVMKKKEKGSKKSTRGSC